MKLILKLLFAILLITLVFAIAIAVARFSHATVGAAFIIICFIVIMESINKD